MFEAILRRVIETNMIEQYETVVAGVTLCSPYRKSPLKKETQDALSWSLSHNGNISFRPSKYLYRQDITDSQYNQFNSCVCISDHERMREFLQTRKHLPTIELEELARSVRRRWGTWTVPIATKNYWVNKKARSKKEEQRKYGMAEEEVLHCAEEFARTVLYCTPRT